MKAFYVAGGDTGGPTSSVLRLLRGASAWTLVASLPQDLYQARASLVGGNMRVTGGRVEPTGGNTEVMNQRLLFSSVSGANSCCVITIWLSWSAFAALLFQS